LFNYKNGSRIGPNRFLLPVVDRVGKIETIFDSSTRLSGTITFFSHGLFVADDTLTFIMTRTKQQKKKVNKGPKLPKKPVNFSFVISASSG
jgi:hypothetical protein